MDPDETLAELRELCNKMSAFNLSFERKLELGHEIRDRFEALDEWLTMGGFRPKEWRATK